MAGLEVMNARNKDELLTLVLNCADSKNVIDSIKKTAPTITSLLEKKGKETIAFLIQYEALEILDFAENFSYSNDTNSTAISGGKAWSDWTLKIQKMFKKKTKKDWMKPATGSLGDHIADLNVKQFPSWPAPGEENVFDAPLDGYKMSVTCKEGNKMAVSCAGEMHMKDWRQGPQQKYRTEVDGEAQVKGIILNHQKLRDLDKTLQDMGLVDGEEFVMAVVDDAYQQLKVEANRDRLFQLRNRLRNRGD